MKLYDISQAYLNIQALLLDPEYEDNEDVLNALDSIEDDFHKKVEQTLFVMRNIEAEIDPIDAEIKRLQAMKKTRKNAIDRIKNRLKANFKATGIEKAQCGLFSVAYREQADNTVELDENLFMANNLDDELVKVKVSPDLTAIKARLKAGESVVGASLVASQVLTIR